MFRQKHGGNVLRRYNIEKGYIPEYHKNGLGYEVLANRIKSVCKRLHPSCVILEQTVAPDLREGGVSKVELLTLHEIKPSREGRNASLDIGRTLYLFKVRGLRHLFDSERSEHTHLPRINSNIESIIIELTYLMSLRGVHTDALECYINENQGTIKKFPNGDLFSSLVNLEELSVKWQLERGINPFTSKVDNNFTIEYIFWKILFECWSLAKFSSFIFNQADNINYHSWHSLDRLDDIMIFAMDLQKKVGNFKYQSFPRELLNKKEVLASQAKDYLEEKVIAGKKKGEKKRVEGMKLIQQRYLENPKPSSKKEVIEHVQNRLLTKFGAPKLSYSTVAKWVNNYLNNKKS